MTCTPSVPYVVDVLPPPYETPLALRSAPRYPAGSLLRLHLPASLPHPTLLQDAVWKLRFRLPELPVILVIREVTPSLLQVIARTGTVGVRGVVSGEDAVFPALHAHMSDPPRLGSDVVEWLTLIDVRMPPLLRHHVADFIDLAREHDNLEAVLARMQLRPSTVRARFRANELPPPQAWFRAARALRAALALQAQPQRNSFVLALELGFADHTGLHRRLQAAFGLKISQLRGTLGWEWILARWVRRALSGQRKQLGEPGAGL